MLHAAFRLLQRIVEQGFPLVNFEVVQWLCVTARSACPAVCSPAGRQVHVNGSNAAQNATGGTGTSYKDIDLQDSTPNLQ